MQQQKLIELYRRHIMFNLLKSEVKHNKQRATSFCLIFCKN